MKRTLIVLLTFVSLTVHARSEKCAEAHSYALGILSKLISVQEDVTNKKMSAIPIKIDCYSHGIRAAFSGDEIIYSSSFIVNSKYEDEIAFILAHELVHVVMEHKMGNNILKLENEADELAMLIMEKAGYNPKFAILSMVRAKIYLVDRDDAPEYLLVEDGHHLPTDMRMRKMGEIIDQYKLDTSMVGTLIPEKTKELISNEMIVID